MPNGKKKKGHKMATHKRKMGARQSQCIRSRFWRVPMLLWLNKP